MKKYLISFLLSLSFIVSDVTFGYAEIIVQFPHFHVANSEIIKVSILKGCHSRIARKRAGETAGIIIYKYFNDKASLAWDYNKQYCAINQNIFDCIDSWAVNRAFCIPD